MTVKFLSCSSSSYYCNNDSSNEPGSSPILACTVELSSAVDIPVNVTSMWSGPDKTTVTLTSSMMEILTRYTITATVDAARNGGYTCQARIRSSSYFITGSASHISPSIMITVGKHVPQL